MPTYEYACTSCANEWEFEQSIRDEPLKQCPKCHRKTARRQISRGTGFILKGSGWYSDLYASPSNQKKESKADKAETSSDAKSTSSSETKTETKTTPSDSGSSGEKPKAKAKPEPSAAA